MIDISPPPTVAEELIRSCPREERRKLFKDWESNAIGTSRKEGEYELPHASRHTDRVCSFF